MGRGGAGTGGRFIALGRGLAMLRLGMIPDVVVLNDCLGETCVKLFGEVEVADEPEPCLCRAGI